MDIQNLTKEEILELCAKSRSTRVNASWAEFMFVPQFASPGQIPEWLARERRIRPQCSWPPASASTPGTTAAIAGRTDVPGQQDRPPA